MTLNLTLTVDDDVAELSSLRWQKPDGSNVLIPFTGGDAGAPEALRSLLRNIQDTEAIVWQDITHLPAKTDQWSSK